MDASQQLINLQATAQNVTMEAMRKKRTAYRVWQRLTEEDLLQIKQVNKEPSELVGNLIYALILFTTGEPCQDWPTAKQMIAKEPRDFLYKLGKAADNCGGDDYEAGRLFLYGKNYNTAGNYQLQSVQNVMGNEDDDKEEIAFDIENRVSKFREVVERTDEFKQANGRTAAVQYMFDFAEAICSYVEDLPEMKESIEKYEEFKKNGTLANLPH